MLEALKFVQGAVSTKDFIPELRHFTIRDGRVTGFNGVLALSSTIEFTGADCAPLAVPMVKAISSCEDVVSMGLTPANRLRVQSGPFKVFIDCVELEDLPDQQPEGDVIEFDGEQMMLAIERLSPFVGNDASRPWTNGILLKDQSAFATNNVCLVEYWVGSQLPFSVNIPMVAIKEMVRVGSPPTHAQLSPTSMTFHYADGRWLRTQLFSTEWPEVTKILDRESNAQPVPAGFFDGLRLIKPFLDRDGAVYVKGGKLHTANSDGTGAVFDVPEITTDGVYVHKMISLLDGVAQQIDFSAYPEPLTFYGDRLRGVIVGRRQ